VTICLDLDWYPRYGKHDGPITPEEHEKAVAVWEQMTAGRNYPVIDEGRTYDQQESDRRYEELLKRSEFVCPVPESIPYSAGLIQRIDLSS